MKRFFLLLTTLALLITSCAKDDTTTIIEGEETLVSFEVMSPKIQTRYGEGLTANKLFYAVYQNGALMDKISVLTADKAIDINNLTADVKIALVSGLTYDILFWAQAADAPYSFDGAKVYIDYAGLTANEESYDAFFRNYRVEINGTKPHRVELYRPFAQLNIATGDLEKAKRAGFDLESTSITVETCTVLDLASGVASEPQRMTFALNDKTEGKYEEYDIISMNYLLVNQEKEVIDVRFNAQGGNDLIERNYFNIPIQRNHQTFMVGDVLTKSSLFHVYINPIFGDDIIYTPPVEYYLYYTSTDGQIVEPYNELAFGANITGNTYKNGKGKITFDGPITEIGERAFLGCVTLESITIPNSATTIRNSAFYNCSGLINVNIPSSITEIGDSAFCGCSNLPSITIPDGITTISSSVFFECSSLTSITIPDSVTEIGTSAFYNCSNLSSITIPDGVTAIRHGVFSGCSSLTSVTIPVGVSSTETQAFYGCTSLTNVVIAGDVVTIGDGTFYMCSNLTSINIPASVTSIGHFAFAGCGNLKRVDITDLSAWCKIDFEQSVPASCPLTWGAKLYLNGSEVTEVIIPSDISEIKDYAFRDCSSIVSITIHEGVKKIGKQAIGSGYLEKVYFKSTTPPTIVHDTFFDLRNATIYVPAEAVDAYKQAEYWSEYADNIFAE